MPRPRKVSDADVLQFVREFYAANGYPANLREIEAAVGSSPSSLLQCVRRLQAEGLVVKREHRARGILPTGYAVVAAAELKRLRDLWNGL